MVPEFWLIYEVRQILLQQWELLHVQERKPDRPILYVDDMLIARKSMEDKVEAEWTTRHEWFGRGESDGGHVDLSR